MVHFILKQNVAKQVGRISAMVLTSFMVLGLGLSAEAGSRYQTEAQGVEACTACLQAPGFQTPKLEAIPVSEDILEKQAKYDYLDKDPRVQISDAERIAKRYNGAAKILTFNDDDRVSASSGYLISACHILASRHGADGNAADPTSATSYDREVQTPRGTKRTVQIGAPKPGQKGKFEYEKLVGELVGYGNPKSDRITLTVDDYAVIRIKNADGSVKKMDPAKYHPIPVKIIQDEKECDKIENIGFPGEKVRDTLWGGSKLNADMNWEARLGMPYLHWDLSQYGKDEYPGVMALATQVTGGQSGGPAICYKDNERYIFGITNLQLPWYDYRTRKYRYQTGVLDLGMPFEQVASFEGQQIDYETPEKHIQAIMEAYPCD